MVDTLWLALGGLMLYWLVVTVAQQRGWLPDQVRAQGPITTIHTQYGKVLLDRLSRPKRFWRAWGNFGVGVSLVVIAGMFGMVLYSGIVAVSNPQPTAVNEPQNVLVIPGVNDFLPLSVAPEIVFGLLIGLIVHEGGHGLFCRVGDIDIESMGVALLAIIPMGAFVEPEEKSRLEADRGSQTRMFAAGVTNNFALSILVFVLLFGPVVGSIAVAPGAPVGDVVSGSPAASAGIDRGDRITKVNGQPIANGSDLDETLTETPAQQVSVTVEDSDGNQQTKQVNRELFLTHTAPGVVNANTTTENGTPPHIQSVNGSQVSTRAEFYETLEANPVTTVTTDNGSFELIAGTSISRVNNDSPLADDVPNNAEIIITEINGDRIVTDTDLQQRLSNTSPGQSVSVTAYVNGTERQYNTTLTDGPENHGYLGVGIHRGTGGIVVDDFGVFEYPAQQFLTMLGGGTSLSIRGFLSHSISVLFLPLAGAVGLTSYNFAGFVAPITNFYTVTGPLGFLGGWVFLLANLLFWTGWININLGFFNCVPAYPLDGGHILRTGTEAVVSRLPIENGRVVTRTITTFVGLSMGAGLILMVFGPQLFN
ncbi:site-2 protease family protein [Halocatena pleomorpha]|uniref:PDZ domain-containing protein n=1 Tax=Halocatena pleomorpha TaxID=1785090 RepID=A0A3P3RE75_9EURY|nr:site-2 protease family protein [Halocatena pleomorpha]RRJ31701.1 PDZ domain-containing protein [Halocatena pleomorpha]